MSPLILSTGADQYSVAVAEFELIGTEPSPTEPELLLPARLVVLSDDEIGVSSI
ncbi:hypothetical protein [Reinekea blandensis]|uniref:hypothetical protein n=1 Tax=Reinekea blandensis TaxID=374838 RepID=UPI000312CB28|nr:hypothetical protein [Reinekea blandensis]